MKNIIIILFGILVIGCAGQDVKPTYSLSDNPTSELNKLEDALAEAKDDKIHLLSPSWFKKANSSYKNARKLHNDGEKVKPILLKVAKGQAQLKKAIDTAQVSRASLKTLNQIRKRALSAGADSKTKGFEDSEESYLEITEAIEKGKLDWVNKNKEEVTEKYLALELEAIKDKALNPARKTHAKALQLEVDDSAPKSFKEAVSHLKETTKFITLNRHEEEPIAEKSKHALFLFKRAISVAQYSQFVKNNEPEDVALWVESQTDKISHVLDADYRDQQFKDQFFSLRRRVNSLRGGRESLEGESLKLKSELTALKENSLTKKKELERLKQVREFNKKYAKVRRSFSKKEAEVYKQGDKLVIRLKGVKFQSGKSVLVSKNYPLMNKVKKAINTFDESRVLIEGHTDSRGSAKVNMTLSKKRAKSVKDYILANSDIPRRRVRSKGLGFKRPIATNKTKNGRSANRRIDIIIDPNKTESLLGNL